jgi:signal transduction histidine kinase/CheY-like chemotaxis protein
MNLPANGRGAATDAVAPITTGRRLFRKYVALFVAVVCVALVTNGLFDIWFSYQEQKGLLVRIQREQAESAAAKISQFVREIEGQMAWATQLPWGDDTRDEWRFGAVRLLRQVPAVTEVMQLDAMGWEQFRSSRQAMDEGGTRSDFSQDPVFIEAMANTVYYGPVYFVHESEPYITLAMAGIRRDYGVIVAQVNLKFIWDVVSQIKVGNHGEAYVVDAQSRLIAHPDISLVLRNIDLSRTAYVQAARAPQPPEPSDQPFAVVGLKGRRVLSAHAVVAPLGWLVFVELPIDEAYAPLYNSIIRSGALLLAALVLAFFAGLFLARRMVVPIQALRAGAARIGGGDLTQRISIKTGDELEALGEQFNSMAIRLQDSYATLERKVEERTHQLEIANLAKSRFLAAASHDLRQPLHALGLFIAQLHGRLRADERKRVLGRVDAALSAMNELFNALLDVSKLDAGVLTPHITEFPIAQLLKRAEATFAGAAREKGLSLRVAASTAWVRSDFILLERIVFNFASNAVRYTTNGGLVVGCRRRRGRLRIEVWDTGAGIPPDERRNIFGEFYRLGQTDQRAGLGLGLAIVDRLCRLLDHPIELMSTLGKGSCFSVSVPLVAARAEIAKPPGPIRSPPNVSSGKLIVVIDDDPLVLEGMGGLFRSWGCRVVTGGAEGAVLSGLAAYDHPPDVIISDYHLPGGKTGIEIVERLRSVLSAHIPAFLISGDTDPEALRDARANGYHLLHKPVDPMALRAMLSQVLRKQRVERAH